MGGRPRGINAIVPPNEVLDDQQIRNERWTLVTLAQHLQDTNVTLQWLARRRLIFNSKLCDHCNDSCSLHNYNSGLDGKRWACESCGIRKSVREGSFFSRSRLTLKQIIIIIYCWSYDMPQALIRHEAEVSSEHTSIDWCNFLREEAETWLEANPDEVGGRHIYIYDHCYYRKYT